MKYTYAWAEMASENRTLKLVTFLLLFLSLGLIIITLKLSFQDSIVIDRGCYSNLANQTSNERTLAETTSFIKMALMERFDTDVEDAKGYVSSDEKKLRDQEQKDFSNRNIKQKIIVNSITESKNGFKVDADRIISVGEIRSAFKFPLTVQVETQNRSPLNPYGLLLISTQTLNEKGKNAENK